MFSKLPNNASRYPLEPSIPLSKKSVRKQQEKSGTKTWHYHVVVQNRGITPAHRHTKPQQDTSCRKTRKGAYCVGCAFATVRDSMAERRDL